MRKLEECYKTGRDDHETGEANDKDLDEISINISMEVHRVYTAGTLEGAEDDLLAIPLVLDSLNEQWQTLTKCENALFSERLKKTIARDAKLEGTAAAVAAAVPGASQPNQPSPPPSASGFSAPSSAAQVAARHAAEGCGVGDGERAIASGGGGGAASALSSGGIVDAAPLGTRENDCGKDVGRGKSKEEPPLPPSSSPPPPSSSPPPPPPPPPQQQQQQQQQHQVCICVSLCLFVCVYTYIHTSALCVICMYVCVLFVFERTIRAPQETKTTKEEDGGDAVIIIDSDDGDKQLPQAAGAHGKVRLQKRQRERTGRGVGVASGKDRSRCAEARSKHRKTGTETAEGNEKEEAGKVEVEKEEAGKEEAGGEKATASVSGKRPSGVTCTWHVDLWRQRLETGVCCACVRQPFCMHVKLWRQEAEGRCVQCLCLTDSLAITDLGTLSAPCPFQGGSKMEIFWILRIVVRRS